MPQVSSNTDIYFVGCQGDKTFTVHFFSHLKETERYRVYVVVYVLCEVRTESVYKTENTNGVINIENNAMEKQFAILVHRCGTRGLNNACMATLFREQYIFYLGLRVNCLIVLSSSKQIRGFSTDFNKCLPYRMSV